MLKVFRELLVFSLDKLIEEEEKVEILKQAVQDSEDKRDMLEKELLATQSDSKVFKDLAEMYKEQRDIYHTKLQEHVIYWKTRMTKYQSAEKKLQEATSTIKILLTTIVSSSQELSVVVSDLTDTKEVLATTCDGFYTLLGTITDPKLHAKLEQIWIDFDQAVDSLEHHLALFDDIMEELK